MVRPWVAFDNLGDTLVGFDDNLGAFDDTLDSFGDTLDCLGAWRHP